MNFQTSNTWPRLSCSDVTEIDTIQEKKTIDQLQIFTKCIRLMAEKVPMPKTAALCAAVLELFKILDRGGRFSTHPQSLAGLTWSDYFDLAEGAALLPCKPRPLGLGDDWWGWDTFNVNTNGGHSISVSVGRYKSTLVGRHRYHYMHYVRLSGYNPCPLK